MKYLLWFCFALSLGALQGQEEAQEGDLLGDLNLATNSAANPDKISAKASSSLEIHGKHRFGLIFPFQSTSSRATQPFLRNQINLSFDPGQGVALSAGIRQSSFFEPSPQLQNEVILDATYLNLYSLAGFWSIYFGWQKFTWGTADQISPIDVLNPKDLRLMPRQQEKQAVLGAYLQFQPLTWLGLSALYLPFYQENPLDLSERDKISGKLGALSTPNAKLELPQDDGQDFANLNFRYPTLGLRLGLFLPGLDLGASYIFKPESIPSSEVSLVRARGVYLIDEVQLKRNYLHYFGLDMRFAFPNWNLWLDSAFILNGNWQPESHKTRSPQWDSVLGLDVSFGPEQRFYANFQYSLRCLLDFSKAEQAELSLGRSKGYYEAYYVDKINSLLAGFDASLEQGLFLRLDFPFDISALNGKSKVAFEELKLSVNLGYQMPLRKDISWGQIYLNPELSLTWNIEHSVQMQLALGLEWSAALGSEKPDYIVGIAHYEEQSQIYLEFSLLW